MKPENSEQVEWEDIRGESWMEGAWTDPGPLACSCKCHSNTNIRCEPYCCKATT